MHYYRTFQQVTCSDFNEFWKSTVPYRQDGTGNGQRVNGYNSKKYSKKFLAEARKCEALRYPGKWQCLYYDCGIVGYEVHRKVNRVVNHHIKEVTEIKHYKSKPKHILKGGTLHETHYYVFSYDGRCYDPYEHDGCPAEHDEWSED